MKFIIPVVVGSVIGYFTNWLAIKMLFRPHEEKRIFGFKVPFTPGLIPKERYRVSESIGKAVGEYLLTPEKITEVLSSDETKSNINNWINFNINQLKNKDKSIIDILDELEVSDYNRTIEEIENKIVDTIIEKFKSQRFQKEILNYLEKNIYEKQKPIVYENIHIRGKELLDKISNCQELKQVFIKEIYDKIEGLKQDGRKLEEIIPEETINSIYENLDNNKGNIIYNLRKFFHEPNLEKRLKTSIGDLVEKNVSRMITMFVDSELIAEKVFQVIDKYINSEDAEEMVLFTIKNSLDKILDSDVSSIMNNIVKYLHGNEVNNIVEILFKQLELDQNQEKIIEILVEDIKSNEEEIKEGLLNYIEEKVCQVLESHDLRISLSKAIGMSINNLFNRPISSLLKSINSKKVTRFTDFFADMINKFGHDSLLEIIRLFDISKIVEEQINSFDVEFTEELILDIAEQELKAITWLGALLGGIMGLLSPLLQILI